MCKTILSFSYEMRSEFDRDITRHDFRLMCIPRGSLRQRVLRAVCEVSPYTWLSEDCDGFGNPCVYGAAGDHHRLFHVRVSGQVQTGLADFEEYASENDGLFRFPSPMTMPGPNITHYFGRLRLPDEAGTSLARARFYMEQLHRDFAYRSGVTDTATTAEQALAQGCGVCQDFAHLLTALCRLDGIPARYAAGMLTGEGQTHAWTEVLSGGRWYGLDPTHGRAVDCNYIKLSHGRDCRDCLVNRGLYCNPARETQRIRASVAVLPPA